MMVKLDTELCDFVLSLIVFSFTLFVVLSLFL